MADYKSFARFADYRPPVQQATDVVRLPDGSLMMTGNRPTQQVGMLDRLRAAASSVIPTGMFKRTAEPVVPWWIAQPANATVAEAPASNAPSRPGQKEWEDIAREAAHEEAIASQLGDVSKRILSSPQLIEGKWFAPAR